MQVVDGRDALLASLERQVGNLFGLEAEECAPLELAVDAALQRAEVAFAATRNKYYHDADGRSQFSSLNASQYATFLYFVSHEASMISEKLADKLYYLNRTLNGCDLYHEVELPTVFAVDHPLGSVLGRATYGNYFFASQGCTVGSNRGIYPVFGNGVSLLAGAMVLGACRVGSNVFISAGTVVKDTDVPDNTLVFGRSPDLEFRSRPAEYFEANGFFDRDRVGEGES